MGILIISLRFHHMESLAHWSFPLLGVCFTFVWLISANSHELAAERIGHAGVLKITNNDSEFIGIDCGATADYIDEVTGLWYQTDENFIKTGRNQNINPFNDFNNPILGPVRTLRSFPEGDRNCYELRPKQGKNNNYLIRAFFSYQNYDFKNQPPSFDLYVGANFWVTVKEIATYIFSSEIIHCPSADIIQVCLVNTGLGTPFMNALELQSLNNSIYSLSLPLILMGRCRMGTYRENMPAQFRYKDDPYHRMWSMCDPTNRFHNLNSSTDANIEFSDSAYKLPSEVLRTAIQLSNLSDNFHWNKTSDSSYDYYVYLHFAEIQKLPKGQKRIINVTFDDINSPAEIITLEYLKPVTLSPKKPLKGYAAFTISAGAESIAPPILNAFELYILKPQPNSLTDETDVNAILEIKHIYGISRINWQGDPCAPIPPTFPWDGLNCSSDKIPRIISLNLSSSKLLGQIATPFSKLQKLESLDLSYNELTGPLQEFLAELPSLKFLNLSGNKLTGSIPKALKEKANLQLSLADNPGLCFADSSEGHKFLIPLIASIGVFLIIIVIPFVIWRLNKKIKVLSPQSQKGPLRSENQEFSYLEILTITNNFETTLGEGGFGKVFLGTLQDDTQVAVKLLSPSSRQGYKEFESEAQVLKIVHHRNLVSLVGYCQEAGVKALIYEYMDNGDLSQQLSVKNPHVLKWNDRIQIAVDVAKGLDYLHNGCKPPIIHRDLKPSNILLSKSMQAKIADFGLSKVFRNEKETHLSTQPAGTPGYIDPEFQRSGHLNKKNDIYSFGMILLELIMGQHPKKKSPNHDIMSILDLVRPKIENGNIQDIVDRRLQGEFDTISAWKFVEIAMSCIEPTPTQRPDISHILQELKECLTLEIDHDRINNHRSGLINSLDFSLPSAR